MEIFKEFSGIINVAITIVSDFFKSRTICHSHGFDHALKVLITADDFLKHEEPQIAESKQKLILLASLLHDVDDRKFFNNLNDENALSILNELNQQMTKKISNYPTYNPISINYKAISENMNRQFPIKEDLLTSDEIEMILKMINLVSTSKNGNTISNDIKM